MGNFGPNSPFGHTLLEVYEPEGAVVRKIFTERAAGTTIREICRQLNADGRTRTNFTVKT